MKIEEGVNINVTFGANKLSIRLTCYYRNIGPSNSICIIPKDCQSFKSIEGSTFPVLIVNASF